MLCFYIADTVILVACKRYRVSDSRATYTNSIARYLWGIGCRVCLPATRIYPYSSDSICSTLQGILWLCILWNLITGYLKVCSHAEGKSICHTFLLHWHFTGYIHISRACPVKICIPFSALRSECCISSTMYFSLPQSSCALRQCSPLLLFQYSSPLLSLHSPTLSPLTNCRPA